MKWQSKKMDTLIHDVVYYKVITDRKHLIKYGRSKNWAMFFKQAYIALIIALVGAIVLIIHNGVNDYWNYNPFISLQCSPENALFVDLIAFNGFLFRDFGP